MNIKPLAFLLGLLIFPVFPVFPQEVLPTDRGEFIQVPFQLPRDIKSLPRCPIRSDLPLFGALGTRFRDRDFEALLYQLPPNQFIGEGPNYHQLTIIDRRVGLRIFLPNNFFVEIFESEGIVGCNFVGSYNVISSTCERFFPLGTTYFLCHTTGDPAGIVILRAPTLDIGQLNQVQLPVPNPVAPTKDELLERLQIEVF